ncbi:MAG: uroporphyrinogen decarboxylase family protein, partial [Saccharofermentanales bacterium]
ARHYLNIGIETAGFSDDLGTQNSLILSPAIIHDFLLPEYARLFSLYKEKNVIINFHSCGHIEPLIDMFIGLGVDVLNPVQSTANDLRSVAAKVRNRLAVQGAISTDLIMQGTKEGIRSEVKRAISLLGEDGGYFCSPDQYMPFPETQMEIFNEAVYEFGSYENIERT